MPSVKALCFLPYHSYRVPRYILSVYLSHFPTRRLDDSLRKFQVFQRTAHTGPSVAGKVSSFILAGWATLLLISWYTWCAGLVIFKGHEYFCRTRRKISFFSIIRISVQRKKKDNRFKYLIQTYIIQIYNTEVKIKCGKRNSSKIILYLKISDNFFF